MAHEQEHDIGGVDHFGSLTDSLHGSLSGGALHSPASAALPGFMSAADKAKIDTVEDGARSIIQWSMGDNNGPGAQAGTATPTVLRYAIYGGTDNWTPNLFVILAQTSNIARPVIVDLYDITNGNVLAEITGIAADVPTVYSTATLTTLPSGLAVIAIRARRVLPATATVFAAYLGIS